MKCAAIVDYGVGNLLSLKRSLDYINKKSIVTSNIDKIKNCSHLILPGVGAFASAMNRLKESGIDKAVIDFAKSGKPVLGICLGMQLMFDESHEFGKWNGLKIISGKVKKISIKGENIPIVGWYKINSKKNVFIDKYNGEYLYLVHSYECMPKNRKNIIGTYKISDNKIVCAVRKENIYGFQFHPEKSSLKGIEMLKDFCSL